jgi:hypothetical protein
MTIATVGDGATDSDFTLDVDGDIELNAAGGDFAFKNNSITLATLSSAGLALGNISEVGSDTDKFITADSGTLKFVTGANLKTYIGADTMEGTAVASTGETHAIKFLREDGDNSSSWQAPTSFFSWGATMRLIGVSAGDHVAIATQYDATVVELGTGTDPDTSYSTSTTADHINMRIVQFPQRIRVKTAIVHWGQGGSTNTTHNFHLMRYDVDADGDLSNGVVLASKADLNSDDYSQRRYGAMTIDTDNDEVTTSQCIIGTMEMITAVNTYLSCKFTIELERY